jgi:pimeloyl-ACP methyl ester carboxylesterase
MPADRPASCHAEISGLSLHYLDWGGGGPPLVMLHGLTGHARTWDHAAAALSGRCHVFALDQRGHGDSDWASGYGIAAMADDLLGFLDALGFGEVTLMGLSMGGIVAYQFTAAHPERVSRLVVLDIGPEIAPSGARQVAAGLASRDIFASEDDAIAQARAANPRPGDETLRHRVRHNLRQLPDGTFTFKWDTALRDLSAISDGLSPDERWAAWNSIRCPVLLVRGDDSDILAPETAERMVAGNPNASLAVVADCGHSITLDRPEGLLAAVSPWLAGGAPG